jgi:asparagine synthase (glutamine-hydrolysing)
MTVCAIAGVWGTSRGEGRGRVMAMLQHMAHRGPDGEALVDGPAGTVGMNRLAVLDPAGSVPPYRSEDGSVAVVFNGEIYNHRALRDELKTRGHLLPDGSDGTILPHLYEEYGLAMFERLVGMFALAVMDRRRGELHLARDRLGIKPLYLWRRGHTVRFASELTAFAAWPDFPPPVREDRLAHYLACRFVPGPDTLLAGIQKLEPGTVVTVAVDGRMRRRTWWTLPLAPAPRRVSARHAEEEFRALWRDVVRDHLQADRRLGFFLSGGLDSTLLAAARPSPDAILPALVLGPGHHGPSYDERHAAAAVAEATGLSLETAPLEDPTPEDIRAVVRHLGEPLGDPTVLSFDRLARAARAAGWTVALSGEGADELFFGYPHYREAFWLDALAPAARWFARTPIGARYLAGSGPGAGRLRAALATPAAYYRGVGVTFPRPELVGASSLEALPLLPDAFGTARESRSRLDQMRAFDICWFLPDDTLLKCDRLGMRYQVEVRVPYLDHRVVEWAWRHPPALFLTPWASKRLPRRAARSLLGTAARRPKRGFPTPLGRWLAGPLRPFARDVLESRAFRERGWVDPRAVDRLLAGVRPEGSAAGRQVWALLALALWAEDVAQAAPRADDFVLPLDSARSRRR